MNISDLKSTVRDLHYIQKGSPIEIGSALQALVQDLVILQNTPLTRIL